MSHSVISMTENQNIKRQYSDCFLLTFFPISQNVLSVSETVHTLYHPQSLTFKS